MEAFTQVGGMGGGASATGETPVVPVGAFATGETPVVPVAAKMAALHTGGVPVRTRGSAPLPE